MEIEPSKVVVLEEDVRDSREGKCSCSALTYDGNKMAIGYAMNGWSRGAIVMSNLVYSTSLVYLASEAAGCLGGDGKVEDECDKRVYGFVPAALIANIAVVTGLLSAFFMPLCGAILDYTSHRWNVGVFFTMLMIVIQIVQIGTVAKTWFVMLILQSLAGFFYQIEVMAISAYLPDMARQVGQKTMTKFQSDFTMVQFIAQIIFLVLVVAAKYALNLNGGGHDDVKSAQVSQALNAVWIIITFGLSWRLMDHVPPARQLPAGRSIWTAGIVQVKSTIVSMYKNYPRSLGVFYLAVVFAESATNSFTTVSVIYLVDYIGLNSLQVLVFFLVAIVGIVPGTQLGAVVTHRTNPKDSWRLSLLIMAIVTVGGAFGLKRGMKVLAFVWGFLIGVTLGWHYPTEGLIFSLCLPKGQDSELSGFFVYCTQILVWLPPLIFSALVQAGINQSVGVMAVACFGVAAIIVISLFPSWPEVLADVAKNDYVLEAENHKVKAENIGTIAEKMDEVTRPGDLASSIVHSTPSQKPKQQMGFIEV